MFNKLFFLIKKIIIAMFIIYAYNTFAISFNMVIPINISNVILVSLFGLISLFELIIFSFFY